MKQLLCVTCPLSFPQMRPLYHFQTTPSLTGDSLCMTSPIVLCVTTTNLLMCVVGRMSGFPFNSGLNPEIDLKKIGKLGGKNSPTYSVHNEILISDMN